MADVGGPDANDDLVIASINSDKFLGHGNTIFKCGSAWLMSGGALTLDTTNPKIEHTSPVDDQLFGAFTPSAGSIDGSSTWTFIGAIATDVTFPGYTGVVPNAGTVEVFDLAAAGPPLMSLIAPIASNEPAQAPSDPPVAVGLFGHSIGVGDIDRDGFGDLVVGAPYSDDHKGRVYVFFGDATGSLSTWIGLQSPVTTDFEDFGVSVLVTDLDDDGHAEILVGASDRHSTTSPQGAGRTHIFDWGDLSGLSTGALHVVTPSQTIEPPTGLKTPGGWFGWTMFDLGEIGGASYPNGRGDIAVHAEATDAGSTTFAGALFVFKAWDAGESHPSTRPYVNPTPIVLQTPTITAGSTTVHAPQTGGRFGRGCATAEWTDASGNAVRALFVGEPDADVQNPDDPLFPNSTPIHAAGRVFAYLAPITTSSTNAWGTYVLLEPADSLSEGGGASTLQPELAVSNTGRPQASARFGAWIVSGHYNSGLTKGQIAICARERTLQHKLEVGQVYTLVWPQ